ncbi:hypothetical protein VQ643_00105 [Pseudomonas sp. F1_0610]|uniref:hypothetical protein n=1 Tax=Pseudomonas sp. F1_0610 TaxID=3114284 RepID=UPI0039C3AA5A
MLEISLPKKLKKTLEKEASDASINLAAHIVKKLERITSPAEYINKKKLKAGLPILVDFVSKLPGVSIIASEVTRDAYWWIKFDIDSSHPLVWRVIQELSFVFNSIALSDPLPTVFKPSSPPPYLNGGPEEFLSWVVESTYNYIDPTWIKEAIENVLPNPIDDITQWDV